MIFCGGFQYFTFWRGEEIIYDFILKSRGSSFFQSKILDTEISRERYEISNNTENPKAGSMTFARRYICPEAICREIHLPG
jgi:hypothetical protein